MPEEESPKYSEKLQQLMAIDVNRLHDAMVDYGRASYSEGVMHGFVMGGIAGALACVLCRILGKS